MDSPTFTGVVQGLNAASVGLSDVTNESKAIMFTNPVFTGTPVVPGYATTASLLSYAPLASPAFTGTPTGITATHVGLGNVTNESKATMFANPTFSGTVTGISKGAVGLGNVENTALSTWAGSANLTTVGTMSSAVLTTSLTGGIGYATGAGGSVIQTTSRTTNVTINRLSGYVQLLNAPGQAAWLSFTVSNSTVAASDTVVVNAATGTNTYLALVSAVAAGSFRITYFSLVGTATDSPRFNFTVVKGVSA